VAQRLFASLEFAVITMREVAQRAHTNVASTHNYFGPKKAMVVETVTKIIDLINASRQQHLVEQRKFAGKDPIAVDDIFRAFVLPICNEIS
jgi:AcrR family transcriptional regulator